MTLLNQSEPHSKPATEAPRRDVVQRASIAQLLLVVRLRARNRRDLAIDLLERAAQVIWVTGKSWFAPLRKNPPEHAGVPVAQAHEAGPATVTAVTEKTRDAHAYRHD